MITVDAVLLGGGSGSRFDEVSGERSQGPKQFHRVAGAPVFIHALRSILSLGCFRQVVVAVPAAAMGLTESLLDEYMGRHSKTLIRVVEGGSTRQESSAIALSALEVLSPVPTRVIIHDACRPVLSAGLLSRVHAAVMDRSRAAWIPVVPVVETLKTVMDGDVVETLPRDNVVRVQTPQVFEYSVIRSLMERVGHTDPLVFTDDAALCEHFGVRVGTFAGDLRNIKLTYGFELDTIGRFLQSSKEQVCEPALVTTSTV